MYLKSRTSQLSVLAAVTLVALTALLLAWPRFQAAWRFLPVEFAIDRYYESREIPTRRMLTLIGFAEEAIAHNDHYRYRDGLSVLHFLRALDVHTPAMERRGEYRLAEAQAIEAVKRAPVQPEAWLRIASVRSILRDEPEEVLEPWRMSVFTGRTHSTLVAPRVGLGLAYLDRMDAESRSMLSDQVLLAWELKPAELLQELKAVDPALAKTRNLIQFRDPSALAAMEERIEKVR